MSSYFVLCSQETSPVFVLFGIIVITCNLILFCVADETALLLLCFVQLESNLSSSVVRFYSYYVVCNR